MKKMRVLLLVVLLIPLINTSASPANAHTLLELSTPSDGQSIEFMPSEFSATFNEDLIQIEGEVVNTLALQSADGTNYLLSSPTITGNVVSARVGDGEYPTGDYLLKYRVVSADGHPVTGEISFSTQSLTTYNSGPNGPVETLSVEDSEKYPSQNVIYIATGLLLALAISLVMKRRKGV
jgi:methionine-rich copper-binding protein CopC